MIKSIVLKNIATYELVEFSNLKKENFIYGSNGSGKTTLSNYLMDIEDPLYSDCSVIWENNIPFQILVYNKKFREKNFNSTGKIPGIFTIGEKCKETADRIEEINSQLEKLIAKRIAYSNTIKEKESELEDLRKRFRDSVWEQIYKKHEAEFGYAFGGLKKKEKIAECILLEYEKYKNEVSLPYEEIKGLIDKIYNSPGEKFSDLQQFPNIDLEQYVKSEIYSKKIIGNKDVNIASFINKLNISDWVNSGRKYANPEDGICPFCQHKTISVDFVKALESFFDDTYTNDVSLLQKISESYENDANGLLEFLDGVENLEKANLNSQLDLYLFSMFLKNLHSEIAGNIEKITNKKNQPSASVELKSHVETIDTKQELFDSAGRKIKDHNIVIDNITLEKENLRNRIWCYLVKENEVFISEQIKSRENCEKAISSINGKLERVGNEINVLNEELKKLNKKDITVQAAVDGINDILLNYGFFNFKITKSQKEDNTYVLKRNDGSFVEDKLSEGEMTFITFLYYMQLVHGSLKDDGAASEKVLVIDDPISSLDSNILFIVSSLIKEELKKLDEKGNKIKQIILLTHNIYFYKEVSFIDGRENTKKDLTYWIIRKEELKSEIQRYEENPIASSYDLYWREIREHENDDRCNIYIQNVMRRIIEHYFRVLGKYDNESLLDKFFNPNEKIIARSLISWINDGSHSLHEDLYLEMPDQITKNYFDVFKKLFTYAGQEEHYNMMMGLRNEN